MMPSKSNYVCLPCEKEMFISKSGVIVEEHMDNGRPYKIWMADLRECPTCGHQCIVGFGDKPLVEHFQDDYEEQGKKVQFHIR